MFEGLREAKTAAYRQKGYPFSEVKVGKQQRYIRMTADTREAKKIAEQHNAEVRERWLRIKKGVAIVGATALLSTVSLQVASNKDNIKEALDLEGFQDANSQIDAEYIEIEPEHDVSNVLPGAEPSDASEPIEPEVIYDVKEETEEQAEDHTPANENAQDLPKAVELGPLEFVLKHSNEWVGLKKARLLQNLARIKDSKPDAITLNEVHNRSDKTLTQDGYGIYRGKSKMARESPVLWLKERWKVVDQGTKPLVKSSARGGTRYANYVTLQPRVSERIKNVKARTVSVISAHFLQNPYGTERRKELFKRTIKNMNSLVNRLEKKGSVIVGVDANADYVSDAGKLPRILEDLENSGLTSTYDELGKPDNGWATGKKHGGTIDYIFDLKNDNLELKDHEIIKSPHSDHNVVEGKYTLR